MAYTADELTLRRMIAARNYDENFLNQLLGDEAYARSIFPIWINIFKDDAQIAIDKGTAAQTQITWLNTLMPSST